MQCGAKTFQHAYTQWCEKAAIAANLLEEFTSKLVITPDSEEGGVITPDFTTPVKGLE